VRRNFPCARSSRTMRNMITNVSVRRSLFLARGSSGRSGVAVKGSTAIAGVNYHM